MRGHNICFNGETLKSVPKLTISALLIWSTDYHIGILHKIHIPFCGVAGRKTLYFVERLCIYFKNISIIIKDNRRNNILC